jgi:uncharacterized protein HemY
VLIVATLALGLVEVSTGNSIGYWLIAAAALLAFGHFRYGPVWLAFRALRAGDADRAARLLSQVRRPSWLSSPQRAYFEFASGALAAARGADADAERHLRAALAHDLRTANDRCAVELELARVLAKRGDRVAALDVLAAASTREPKPELAEQLRQVGASLETEA